MNIRIQLQNFEDEVEAILNSLEMDNKLEAACKGYESLAKNIRALNIQPEDKAYQEYCKVYAYCLQRLGNMLRAIGRQKEAAKLGEEEFRYAKESRNTLAIARSNLSQSANLFTEKRTDEAIQYLNNAFTLFQSNDSYDFKQGLGWCWIFRADLVNSGMIRGTVDDVIEAATQALTILEPIKNWAGVARAYDARSIAYENSGNIDLANLDRKHKKYYDDKSDPRMQNEE